MSARRMLALGYGGLALAAIGFVLIAATWGRVASLGSVALQVPHIVSGGLTGLGLIIIGATAMNIHAKLREAAERERATHQLSDLLRHLADVIEGTSGDRPHRPRIPPTGQDGPDQEPEEEVAWDA